MSDSVGIIITSRVQSRRLPAKALRKIGNRTLLEILIDNLQRQNKYPVVLAIPKSSDCDILEEIGVSKNVKIHRGQDESPLHRIYEAARKFRFDHIVRITQDDIIIDAEQMVDQIWHHIKWGADYTFISKIPEGAAGEVMSFRALDEIVEEIGERPVEFISYYIRKPERFSVREYRPHYAYQFNYRLTIDYEEDLQLMRAVYALLAPPVNVLDIINLLKAGRNKHLLEINRMPEITVYTCCFNQGKYIQECLDSIAAQDFEDYDVLICDDGSTDDTPAKISEWVSRQPESYRKRIRVERWENIGLPASANRAVHLARGKYIVRVDSDDTITREFLGVMHGRLKEDREAGAVFCGFQKVDREGVFISEHKNGYYHPGCAMFRAGYVKDTLYKEDLQHYEGLDFWKRFSKHHRAVVIDDILWSYRQHSESKSHQDTDERKKAREAIG